MYVQLFQSFRINHDIVRTALWSLSTNSSGVIAPLLSETLSTVHPILYQYQHNHCVILRKLLTVLSLGLGLQSDALWNLHHRFGTSTDEALDVTARNNDHWIHGKDHLRYCMYYPHSPEDSLKKYRTWIPSHTDL